MFEIIYERSQIFFDSMLPWLEARFFITLAILLLKWSWWEAFSMTIIGNFLLIPVILLFFNYIGKFLRKYTFWIIIMDWIFERTRRKADIKIMKDEYLGSLIFIALPLPFIGALIAYLFNLDFSWSLVTIFNGIIIAAIIMLLLTFTNKHFFF